MCLSFVFNIAYIFLKSELRFQWEISWSRLSALIGYGLPLLGLAAMGTLILTADKLIISRFLGLEALGLYSIAAMTLTYLYSFPNSIGIVLIPNVHEKFGERQNPLDLTGYLDKAAYFYSNAMPALIVFAWFTMPYLVCLLLPKFAAGIPALQLLILGAYFMALNEPHNNFLIVIKKHFCLFPITFLSAVFTFFLVFVVVRRGGGIKGAASAMSLSFFLNFSMVFFFARGCVGSLKETISNYLVLVLKFLGMAAFIYVISFLTGPMRPLQAFVSQMTLCAIFSLLPALLICRRFAIWDALVSRFLKSG
jgi:O-antigen/teichoic acid export membrane protein